MNFQWELIALSQGSEEEAKMIEVIKCSGEQWENHSHDERESSSKLCHGCFYHKLYPSIFCSHLCAFLIFLNSLLHTK